VKGHVEVTSLPQAAVYEDKDVLAAQPWFARSRPVFDNSVARPSTAAGDNYNRVSTDFFPDREPDSQGRANRHFATTSS
jgi:hypothetical protein